VKEITIIGAGLSGLTAAINLAREGYKVKIFERCKDCGMRFQGDLQGIENWSLQTDTLDDLTAMNIKIDFHCQPFYHVDYYDFELNKIEVTSKNPIFYLVRRGGVEECIDIALKRQAKDLGVEINFNKPTAEKFADIIASGPKRVNIAAKGMTFNLKTRDTAIAIFNHHIASSGYAYLLTSNGKGTLSTVLFKDFRKLNLFFERTIGAFKKIIDFDLMDGKKFIGYGNFALRNRYEKDGKLFVGEAAGLQDFWLGFGMRTAITSGYLAARSIIENRSYDYMIKNRFKDQMKISIVNRFIFGLGNRSTQFFLRKLGNAKNPTAFLNEQSNPSLIKNLIFPISKLLLKKNLDKAQLEKVFTP